MTTHYERGRLLYGQGRYDLAVKELREHLAECPNDPHGHAVLGLCLMKQWPQEAEHAVRTAVGVGPDSSFAHYALACVLHQRGRLDEAAAGIAEAVRLEPETVGYFYEWAQILLAQERWSRAARMARQGLAIDPQHIGCANSLGVAWTEMDCWADARSVLEAALARDPANALTHTNLRWALLPSGDVPRALRHFREALRLDPTSEAARAGFVEALKARNWVYRFLLPLLLLAGRSEHLWKWLFILLLVCCGFTLVNSRDRAGPPQDDLILLPLGGLLVGLVVALPLVARPLFDLLLQFDKLGRLSLTRDQAWASCLVGGCVLAAVGGAVAGAVTNEFRPIAVGTAFLLLTVPLTMVFGCPAGWPRRLMLAYIAILALVGPGGQAVASLEPDPTDRPAPRTVREVQRGRPAVVHALPRARPQRSPSDGAGIASLFLIGVFFSGWVSELVSRLPARK